MNIKENLIIPSINSLKDSKRKILVKKNIHSDFFQTSKVKRNDIVNEIESCGFYALLLLYEKAPWYVSLGTFLLGVAKLQLVFLKIYSYNKYI